MTNEVTTPSGGQTIFPRVNFLKTFESRFAQRAANGRIFGASGVTPPDPLEVASGQDANWLGTNVYQVGQTVEARTAAYTGGAVPITYRYRFQFKPTGDSSFINGPWNNTTNSKNPATYLLTETGEIKFQSQASDSSNPVVVINSITDVESVVAAPIITTIGNLSFTLNGNSIDANQPQQVTTNTANTVSVAISGDATPSYSWSVKTGAGTITGSGDTIDFTGTADGTCRISVVVTAPNASDSPQEQSIVFLSTPPAPDPIPALELDFANSLSLVDSVSGTDLTTYSRASTGTYVDASGVIQTAANDEARFDHDPVTGESLGLLIEESRTNVVLYSVPLTAGVGGWFVSANWAKGQLTLNQAIAPDGANDAVKYKPTATSQPCSALQYTGGLGWSIFVKKINCNKIQIAAGGYNTCNYSFDTDTFNPGNTPSNWSYLKSEKYPNGWVRLMVGFKRAGGGANNPAVFISALEADGYTFGNDAFYAWGLQSESIPSGDAVGFPTSYIPTSGSAASRAADVCSIQGADFSSWWNDNNGTIFAEFADQTYATGLSKRILSVSDSASDSMTAGNGILLGSDATDVREQRWRVRNGATVTDFDIATSVINKTAITYGVGHLARVNDDGDVQTSTDSPPTGLDQLHMLLNSPIKRFAYYPYKLTNEQLKALTA